MVPVKSMMEVQPVVKQIETDGYCVCLSVCVIRKFGSLKIRGVSFSRRSTVGTSLCDMNTLCDIPLITICICRLCSWAAGVAFNRNRLVSTH